MRDRFSVQGRTALVTGASRGIGRAIALGLAQHGADVAVHYAGDHDAAIAQPRAGEATCAAIEALGTRALPFDLDLSEERAPARLLDAVSRALGPPDILVLSASVQFNAVYTDISREQFDRQVTLNLRATLELMQLCVPPMAARGWGRVLTVGSVQQHRPHREMAVYAALKSAQYNLCMLIAREHAADGVTANNIAPGFIDTDRNQDVRDDPAKWEAMVSRIPVQRAGVPDDIVGAAVLLCSDAGAFITGVNLDVAGGSQLVV